MKGKSTPSNKKLLNHESIQTFFSTPKFNSCCLYCIKHKASTQKFNYTVYSLHFYQTPNHIRKKI